MREPRLVRAGFPMFMVDVTGGLALLVLGAVVVGTLWWAHVVSTGVRFRPVLLGVTSVGYVFLFLVLETGNWLGVDQVAPLDLLLLGVAGVVAYLVSVRTTRILYDRGGRVGYRGSALLVIVWLVILLAEVFVQQVILGQVTFLHLVVVQGLPSPAPAGSGSVPHPYRVVVTTVDALFALSTGVALGDNAALYAVFARHRWRRALRT